VSTVTEHRCYSCGRAAQFEIESVGPSHRMVIWVCADHVRGERILTKIENGAELVRTERTTVTYEPRS
jgi:hypothetical protein